MWGEGVELVMHSRQTDEMPPYERLLEMLRVVIHALRTRGCCRGCVGSRRPNPGQGVSGLSVRSEHLGPARG